jgi:YggT family protein
MFQIGILLAGILRIFLLALLARLILDYVRMFNRGWQPKGVILWFAETVYSITDKPLNALRRFIPPLRIGSVALDLSFLVLFFAIQILIPIVSML